MKNALVLRTCDKNLKSYNDFQWKESGVVKALDWDRTPSCGNGLHGLLWGEGDGSLLDWSADAKWLIVEVATEDIVDLGGKVKFPKGRVVFVGDRVKATEYMLLNAPAGKKIVGATATAGNYGTATAGDYGTATAGNYGTATAGYRGTATAGDSGTATAGNYGTATAGDYGTATAGNYGTATAGNYGTATAGYRGTATAGDSGTISILWWDEVKCKYRVAVGEVGENGIEPNKPYHVVGGKLVLKK